MIFTFKKESFIKSLFNEPNKDKYSIPSDLSIDSDFVWISHKEDSKNLTNDYKKIRKDLKKSFNEYKNRQNG